MKKLKPPTSITTAILTLITVFFWAGFEVYRSLTAKPPSIVPPSIINPLDPTLDNKTLDSIPKRLFFTEDQIKDNKATGQGATLVATQSATPTPPTTGHVTSP